MNICNKYGAVTDATVLDVSQRIHDLVKANLTALHEKGATPETFRAAAQFLSSSVDAATAEFVLMYGIKRRRGKQVCAEAKKAQFPWKSPLAISP